jgi:hypothetical protein
MCSTVQCMCVYTIESCVLCVDISSVYLPGYIQECLTYIQYVYALPGPALPNIPVMRASTTFSTYVSDLGFKVIGTFPNWLIFFPLCCSGRTVFAHLARSIVLKADQTAIRPSGPQLTSGLVARAHIRPGEPEHAPGLEGHSSHQKA